VSPGVGAAKRWSTFVRNHAHAVLACDFFVAITVGFPVLYVFVVFDSWCTTAMRSTRTTGVPIAGTDDLAQKAEDRRSGDLAHLISTDVGQARTYLLNQSIVRCQARSAAALL